MITLSKSIYKNKMEMLRYSIVQKQLSKQTCEKK
jgi:hypothetical protein